MPRRRSTRDTAALGLGAIALLALASAVVDPAPWRRALVVVVAAVATAVVLRAQRRLARDLEVLAEADLEDGTLPVVATEAARTLIGRLEDARGAWSARTRTLEQQRDVVAEHLTRAAERLRDPVADARRGRISRLEGVAARVTVGRERADARLVDLTAEIAVLAIPAELARRLVPGVPVGVRVTVGDEVFQPADAVAIAPARTDGGLVEWLVRFGRTEPAPGSVLWQAAAMRGAERVRPPPHVPATATLLAPFGDVPATVADLSADGVGLLVSLDPTRLGDLDRALVARLTFPTLGKIATLSAELCSVARAPAGVRLGLRFSGSEEADRARVAEWLAACAGT